MRHLLLLLRCLCRPSPMRTSCRHLQQQQQQQQQQQRKQQWKHQSISMQLQL
jgi:hypothetical protein